jgi:formylglycine-generating enzyme required for sulfatase activity/dienelactone hydrolase
MGEVYRARDTRLERTVAIKILPSHLSADPDLKARFDQEARSISGLQHPNICVLHDIGFEQGQHFMVMEYVTGRTLDNLIPAGGMPVEIALKYAVQMAEGLAHAHNSGVVHRDLKPSNIMADDNGRVKVLDFGLAKLAEPATGNNEAATIATTPGMIVGTTAYMSPEQAEGRNVDARSDIFSFGSVFYEMLTGKRAFEGQSAAALLSSVIRDDPKPVSEIRKDIPPEVRRIVARCLKKSPDQRYSSATELGKDLKTARELLYPESGAVFSPQRIAHEARKPWVLLPLLAVVIAVVLGAAWLVKRAREIRWAREVALPKISQLADEGKFGDAYALAVRAEKVVPDDPALVKLWPVISYTMNLDSTPEGAVVTRQTYGDPNSPSEVLGTTPIKNMRAPRGNFTWKFEKMGYGTVTRTTIALIARFTPPPAGTPLEANVTLDEVSTIPAGMVRVSVGKYPRVLFIPGFEGVPDLALTDYWLDQYEVTNRQFKQFVDAGGYKNPQYWKQDFRKDGKTLSWDEAMVEFHDAAGRPGPKDWIEGQYPKGQDDFPVTGVSWYEAAAFAEYSGKTLPTIFHWNRAAGPLIASVLVPLSNFGGSGILPAGSKRGISPWGNYDMAGNVKEWVWNEAEQGKRYVLGGAWDEPTYMFIDPDAQSPFLRAANIGFRCMKPIDGDSIPKTSLAALPSVRPDLSKSKPVSDEVFNAYRGLYAYDKTPLNATVETFGKDDEDWKIEKVTYPAAYGNETAITYLILPKKAKPPYQTVLFFPGSNALTFRSFSLYSTAALDAIVRSGRAVIYPIYKGTYERGDGMESDVPNMSAAWRDHVIMWVKDASRALDYADTRPDLDHEKLAYYGYSWGSVMGSMIPAIDPRIRVVVLALGGLEFQQALPEVEPINFASRVKQPVLMLNGRYDFFFPVESNQEPLFRLLGSKKDQKKHILYDTSHSIPRNELIKQTLDWLDEYLGPVK